MSAGPRSGAHRLVDVPTERMHLWLMLVLTFTTGINDAVGYLGLDKVFTGNMTGNVVVLGMALVGAACTVLAFVRWARVERAMRLREPLPHFSLGWLLTAAIVLVAILLAVTLTAT